MGEESHAVAYTVGVDILAFSGTGSARRSRLAMIPHLAQYAGWIGLVGYLVLVAGCTVKTK